MEKNTDYTTNKHPKSIAKSSVETWWQLLDLKIKQMFFEWSKERSLLAKDLNVWIGAKDNKWLKTKSQVALSSGYSNWQRGQPSSLSGCVVMLGDIRKPRDNGKWFVYSCESKHYAVVCQIDQTECCSSVIISSDINGVATFMGIYEKHSLDTND